MLHFLPSPLIALITAPLIVINVVVWVTILLACSLIKLILPFQSTRKVMDPILLSIAEIWISGNSGWMKLTQKMDWDVQGLETLNKKSWHMVVSNHQSWVDILVLQHVFNRRIPLLKFFLKQELIVVPFLGLAWWALDFPFMKRHTAEQIRKNPELATKDLETTKKACAKFELIPTSVMNFLEGTRNTPEKHAQSKSPYKHLLRPKSGGIAFAINALGDKFHSLLDVTIIYPEGTPTFGEFMSGQTSKVIVRVRELEIPEPLMHGDYQNDPAFRKEFQAWVSELWQHKDELIATELAAVKGEEKEAKEG